MSDRPRPVGSEALWRFTAVNTAAACAIAYLYVLAAGLPAGSLGWTFLHAALFGQILAFCLLLGAALLGLSRLTARVQALAACGAAAFTLLHVFLLVDSGIYRLFKFHFNGLVLNVLTTPGGWESMHIVPKDVVFFAFGVGLLFAGQAWLFLHFARRASAAGHPPARRRWVAFAAAVLIVGAAERALYAYSDLYAVREVTRASKAVPLYRPFTVKRLARKLGMEIERGPRLRLPSAALLQYPKAPLRWTDPKKAPNVLWVVLDSWRSDAFSREFTPNTWALAKDSQVFERHMSGGNATRFGIFSMLYGVYGSYWHAFLADQRGPVLIDRLKALGYRFKVLSSTSLSFPEFRRTAFVEVPDAIEDDLPGAGPAEKDAAMVPALERFLDQPKDGKPFFAFLFTDSSHGPYSFPKEHARYTPYVYELSYLQLDLRAKRDQLFNSYLNSVRYSDFLVGKMLKALKARGLEKDTIVIVTGDHGEEFFEYGVYGHNGSFSPAQIQVPLIVKIPGMKPRRHDRLTSHHDLPATLLTLLGVDNPAADYSQGRPLFGMEPNPYVVSCSWDRCALLDSEGAVTFGTESYNASGLDVLDRDYKDVPDPKQVLSRRSDQLVSLMKEMGAFSR